MHTIFYVIMAFGIVMFILIFLFAMMMIFGTKTKSKLLARQIKSMRGATDLSKEDIENILTNLSGATIKSKNKIVTENEDDLKNIADTEARINKDAIKETAKAIKEGLINNTTYCKYCGSSVDSDSVYCKSCGKKL